MKTHCTRFGCPRPTNIFADLDDRQVLKTVQQKYCTTCGMPQILGDRYIPLKLLGQGGFGAAFLAVDRYTPKMRQCVVKQFQPSGDLQPDQLRMAQDLFDREAEALEDLGNRHPQIPNLYAFFELHVPSPKGGKAEDYFYLVQEFIDGENMEELLAQRGPLSETEVREIMIAVLNVLTFVHKHDTIHRDIKPSNIMRSRQGRIYLLDFGAVKQITRGQGAKAGQQRSTGIYSMGFAPPEQMHGDKVYPATDLYALGVTAITLLTGKDPSNLYDSYSGVWNWRGHTMVSDRLEAVLNQLLRSTPSERLQSADEVLTALKGTTVPGSAPIAAPMATPQPPSGVQPQSTTLQGGARAIPQAMTAPPAAPPPPISPPTPAPMPVARPAVATPTPAAQLSPRRATPPAVKPSRRSLSAIPVLKGAMFTGFMTGLFAIAIISVFPSFVGLGIVAIVFVAIALLQVANIVGGSDLPIFALLGLGIALGYEYFRDFQLLTLLPSTINPLIALVIFPVITGALIMAGSILFLLIHRILARLM
ncbi:MAG: protein kinase [Leptolyngbyaceae bacterium]|nr:protein kinase [Leptolyngbyaceae bacterium]